MTTYDHRLEKWRAKLAAGTHESCMHAESLRPGSFCAVFDMCWGGPGCGMLCMLAPEYFDDPADFVAFVRVVELPRSLELLFHLQTVASDEPFPPAEAYLPLAASDDERAPLEAAIAAADAALARSEVTPADAESVIAAFNAAFGGSAKFIASGDATCFFTTGRITDSLDGWSGYAVSLIDSGEPDVVVKRLLDAGEFDPGDPAHVELVREILAYYPNC